MTLTDLGVIEVLFIHNRAVGQFILRQKATLRESILNDSKIVFLGSLDPIQELSIVDEIRLSEGIHFVDNDIELQ